MIKFRILRWEMILDYLSGPNVITSVLVGGRKKEIWLQKRRQCDEEAKIIAMQPQAKECQGMLKPPEAGGEASPRDSRGNRFTSERLLLDIWPLELQENKFLLFSAMKKSKCFQMFVIMFHSGNEKLIQCSFCLKCSSPRSLSDCPLPSSVTLPMYLSSSQ
jgi:hypothetical protein